MEEQPNNPLHGVTLKTVVEDLVEFYGFEELGNRINIRCFTHDPSVKSSLKFLRKTQWARDKVEALYVARQEVMQQQHTIYGKNKS
ncbi:MAG: hypothetical protein ACJA0E_000180 [Bermanella sp.]|jgi:uncharacterized protein (DUF2132 family)